ncbi:MAG TPA: methyl-accepting chemotaxis protein [Oligoflexus sp.]|uniref:methyl-accepting chemotaxis protein n=1 Tax=Oligoflexus sp. TaxID=1971216 RepID=UPI002D3044FD|nr:methyl-accepting chemotaxis protein [Oligoflexus sp.]HYX36922.1 methyl-accepting chemotaxis protein [Oligoflexus sp.]
MVAEEVGNLAKMSGTAAKEIHSLIDDSQKKVVEITQGLRERLDRTVEASFGRIHDGMSISDRCDTILQEVVSYTSNVEGLMVNIAQAAREQSEGVRNITIAMSELDTVIHSNSEMAQETLRCSQDMTQVAFQLQDCTTNLEQGVFGKVQPRSDTAGPDDKTTNSPEESSQDHPTDDDEPSDSGNLPRTA